MRLSAHKFRRDGVRAGLATALMLFAGTAAVALPHLELKSSDPVDGSELVAQPETVTLEFSESVESEGASATLVSADRSWALESAASSSDAMLRFLLPTVGFDGDLAVDWTVLGEDGHPVTGRIRFTVASASTGSEDASSFVPINDEAVQEDEATRENPANSWGQVVARFGSFGATLALFGVVGFLLFVAPKEGEIGDGLSASLRRLGLVAVAAQLIGVCVRLVAQTALLRNAFGEMSVTDVAGSSWGRLLLIQMIAGVVLGVAFLGAPRFRRGIAALGALVLALALPWVGHAASGGALEKAVDSVHVASSGVWIGGLGVLLALLAPVRGWTRSHDRVAVLLPRFARVAMVVGPLTVLTGALNAWFHAPALKLWLSEPYGQLLSLKIVLVGAVLALGGIHHLRLEPLAGTEKAAPRLLRTGSVELLIAVSVVLVTAFLVATAMD